MSAATDHWILPQDVSSGKRSKIWHSIQRDRRPARLSDHWIKLLTVERTRIPMVRWSNST